MDFTTADTALAVTDPQNLVEQEFEVAVVKDATAAAKHPELGDGYAAALTNFAYIASAVLDTEAVVSELRS